MASKTELEISATFILRTEARRSLRIELSWVVESMRKSPVLEKQQHLLEYKAWKLQFRFFLVHTTRARLKTIPGFLSSFFGGQASLVSSWVGMPGLDLRWSPWVNRKQTTPSIRGHRPSYSLGGKILANREGDYESCFREWEENYKAGYGKGMGRKFLVANFLCKIRGGRINLNISPLLTKKLKIFCFFEASGRG